MTSERQLVAIRSGTVLPCMICPICHKLFRNATTISECLHTFCKKCIYNTITKEELDCCPVCNVYLGTAPLEKLRPDHVLQDIRALLFNPSTRKQSKEPKSEPSNPLPVTIEPEKTDDVPSVPLPARRKKRSLSSLVRQPKASYETHGMIRRKKPEPKNAAPRGSTLWISEPTGKEDDGCKSSSPHLTLSKITRFKEQSLQVGESSEQKMPQKGADDPVVSPLVQGMADMWKPLNCLVEAADVTRLGNHPMPLPVTKSISSCIHSGEAPMNKTKSEEKVVRFNVVDEKGSHLVPSSSAKPEKDITVHQEKDAICEGGKGNVAQQALVKAVSTVSREGVHPIWFSLVASDSQEGDAPLPQIPSCYLRVKNANLPVSFIQKYIVKKLNLYSEAEMQITMQGHLVPSDLQMRNLINLWSRRAPKSETVKTAVGRSAEDFVMVLCYGRKT